MRDAAYAIISCGMSKLSRRAINASRESGFFAAKNSLVAIAVGCVLESSYQADVVSVLVSRLVLMVTISCGIISSGNDLSGQILFNRTIRKWIRPYHVQN